MHGILLHICGDYVSKLQSIDNEYFMAKVTLLERTKSTEVDNIKLDAWAKNGFIKYRRNSTAGGCRLMMFRLDQDHLQSKEKGIIKEGNKTWTVVEVIDIGYAVFDM